MPNKVKVEFNDKEREVLSKKLSERRDRLRHEMEDRREAEIEKSLSEIYRDDDGKKIDVNRMKIKRRQGFLFWFFNALVIGLIAVVVSIGIYYYFVYGNEADSSSLKLEIECPSSVAAGEEFTYKIKYNNPEYVALKNVSLSLTNSDNFIVVDTEPKIIGEAKTWDLGRIDARSSGEVTVKGKIIDKAKASSVMLAEMTYMPENFSSEFKKETSATTLVRDVGFDVSADYSNTALVNQQGEIKLNFKPLDGNNFQEFIIAIEKSDNIDIKNTIVSGRRPNEKIPTGSFKVDNIKDVNNSWLASGLNNNESFEIIYKTKEKVNDKENIKVYLKQDIGGKKYIFWEKDISLDVMNSDLNLNLIMNGSQSNKPVNFGDTLNYSIAYSNKGETAMKDVVIMAVLDSDFVDWASLKDKNNGSEKGNTIVWTKNEIPALEEVGVDKGGSIDFSVNVLPFSENDLSKDFQIKAFAQYNIGSLAGEGGSSTVPAEDQDSRSNTIISLINSDMSFREELRYFDENNLPVGNGPLPPKVGETTSFKAYWNIGNNLHDLNELSVETTLPEGVEWDDHNRTSVGTITYDEAQRKVVWQIGRLPITVFRADAEFNVSFTPKEDDRNRIVVLLPGADVKAVDSKTGSSIEKNGQPKTTKLDDDEIANMSSDGRIR